MIVELLVVLVAAKLAAEVAERLRTPAVLGEILAGVIVGPTALGLVHGGEVLHFLGELGVILLLFEVGMETDLGELRAVGRASLLVAVVGVALPFALGTGGLLAMGEATNVAIFVGAALTATSVGITARVFGDLRALATIEARTVLGAAVADDVLGLVILTVVVKLTTGESVSPAGIAVVVLLAVGFLVVGTGAGLRLAPGLIRLVDRRGRSSGSLLIAAMGATLGLAALAEDAGLAPIIGAFVAGLAVARSDGVERVRRDVTPIAHLLVPVFFLQIGLEADLGAFAKPRVLVIAAVLLVAAVVGKVLAAGGAAGSPGDKSLIGLGMLPRGEVGLIFAGIGLSEGVLGNDLYAALLLVVLATTLVTPPLLRWRIGAVRRRPAPAAAATAVPEGGWLVELDGIVVLRGTPPPGLALVLGLEAAVLVADARPGPRLLQWFLSLPHGLELPWDEAARAQLVAVLRAGNARSWRFLESVGLLEKALPDLAAKMDERRADASELDPAHVFEWSTVEGVRRLAGTDDFDRLEQSDVLLLAALIVDAAGDESLVSEAALDLAERVGLEEDEQRDVVALVAERGRLRAAAVRPDGLDEARVVQLATHLETPERARALYLLELACEGLERWERQRVDELHARLQQVLSAPDLAESRRVEAQSLATTAEAKARVRSAPRPWLLTQPAGAIARQAALLDPPLRSGKFRVAVSGTRIDIAARDRQGLLAVVTGVLASAGLEIRSAASATWPDGVVAMSFVDGSGNIDAALLRQRLEAAGGSPAAVVPVPDAHVAFDHHASPWYTILDVVVADRPGLLAALAGACSAVGASIHGLVAQTVENVAHDRFELTDRRGEKLDPLMCQAIRTVLAGDGPPRRLTRKALTRTKHSGDRLETARP